MADQPGRPATTVPSMSFEFNWKPIGGDKPVQPTIPVDQTRPGADRPAVPGSGVAEISYRDPQFDQKLWQSNASTLRIKDFPPGVSISSWVDDKGFFMWYRNGNDNFKPHYLPPGLKTIEVNGVAQDVDEMRIQASMEAVKLADRQRVGFSAVNGLTNPLEFAQRMGSLGAQELANQEKWLKEAAANSPTNPYFHVYLADIYLAQAFKPIMDQLNSGQSRIDMNTPYTQQKMQAALAEAQLAQQITKQQSSARFPNTSMQPGLNPFFLNRHSLNPDLYWHGALYQSWQREVSIKALQGYLNRFSSVELPPALPPR